jgi:CheY-like chemotaxis protein
MLEPILLVDDEVYVLESLRRELGDRFTIEIARGGAEALEKLALGRLTKNPHAVVVTDYRMPGMNGIEFLTRATALAPHAVRMMLTGNADVQLAIDAVNQGRVFRFLTKPCPPELMSSALEAGIRQYRLVTAEKTLLEQTLVGSIGVMADMLSIVNPKAYGKSMRIRRLVSHVAGQLGVQDAWQYELAAALSQLGWIIFAPELLDKIGADKPLAPGEERLFLKHPTVAKRLLARIPRLELTARIIEGQQHSYVDLCLDQDGSEQAFVDLGSHILKTCLDYDRLTMRKVAHKAAVQALRNRSGHYLTSVLDALESLPDAASEAGTQAALVAIDELEPGMLLAEPVCDGDGRVLVDRDTRLTQTNLVLLMTLAESPAGLPRQVKVAR